LGLPIPAAELTEVIAIGVADAPTGAAEAGPPPGALQLLQQGAGGARPPGQSGKAQGQRQAGEGIAEQLGQQAQGCAGLTGLALALDLQGGLIEHGSHLGLDQRQGLGDIGWTKHGPLEFLELLVESGVAGGAGHGLAQGLEFGLSALEAGGLGVVQ